MTRIALVTCIKLPEPDTDEVLLTEALLHAGLYPEVKAWDDDSVEWSRFDLAIVRSTWNYYLARDRFLAWAEATAAQTRLVNPLPALRWNTHKRYLKSLESAGIPIVPTQLLVAGTKIQLTELVDELGYDRIVVKPAVSAGSYKTERFDRQSLAAGNAHLAEILATSDAMVQPYMRSVESEGERAIVWIDSTVTHAVRKQPRFGRDQESVSAATTVTSEERQFAERALAAVPFNEPLLYARIDVAKDDQGVLRLMELETTEPSLFLAQHPPALERFVAAIENRAKQISRRLG